MVEALFLVNVLFAVGVIFTTKMIENHLHKLDESMRIYLDPMAYKPEEKIHFLSTIIERYSASQAAEETEANLDVMIEQRFQEEKIGAFWYHTVQRVAISGKLLLWVVTGIQIGTALMISGTQVPVHQVILIAASILLCMTITFMGVLHDIREEKEQTKIKMQDYILHSYPVELYIKKEHKLIQSLLEKIEELEGTIACLKDGDEIERSLFGRKEKESTTGGLTENDIDLLLTALSS